MVMPALLFMKVVAWLPDKLLYELRKKCTERRSIRLKSDTGGNAFTMGDPDTLRLVAHARAEIRRRADIVYGYL